LQAMRYFLIISGLFLIVFSSCKKLKDPVFDHIQNVKVDKVAQGVSTMTLEMAWFNPNNFTAKLKEATGEAWMDSTYLGRFYVDSAMTIPANSNFIVPVKLEVEMRQILKHSMAAFLNEQVLITIKGKAKVGKSGIYRNIPLHYEGRQNLEKLFR
jgi:LEA14-like dessication related protein